MNVLRRFALAATTLCVMCSATVAEFGRATAQTYPNRPVRIMVGTATGSAPDVLARLMAQWLQDRLGQPFVIENRPGAGTNIATEIVVRAPPDGHTLLLVSTPNAINATLYNKLSFNFIRDIAPVASIMQAPEVLVVHPSVPVKSVTDLIAYAKANPGKLNMASPGNGSGPHLSGELFKRMAGIEMAHVPYRGGPQVMTDLLAGHVHLTFSAPVIVNEHIKAGNLRALAITTASRWDALPDVPAVAEFLPGYASFGWFGIGAPKDTPREIATILNREINASFADRKTRARLTEMGGTVLAGSPADFAKFIADETEKRGQVVRFSGAKAE